MADTIDEIVKAVTAISPGTSKTTTSGGTTTTGLVDAGQTTTGTSTTSGGVTTSTGRTDTTATSGHTDTGATSGHTDTTSLSGHTDTSATTGRTDTSTGTTSGHTDTSTLSGSTNTVSTNARDNVTTTSGRADVQNIGGRTDVSQLMLSDSAVNLLVNKILQSNQGLAATVSGEKAAGIYGATTTGLLAGNLLAQTSAEVEARRAPTVSTIGPQQITNMIGGTSSTEHIAQMLQTTNIGGSKQTTEVGGTTSTGTSNIGGTSTTATTGASTGVSTVGGTTSSQTTGATTGTNVVGSSTSTTSPTTTTTGSTAGPRTQTQTTTTPDTTKITDTSSPVDIARAGKAMGALGLSSMAIDAFKSGGVSKLTDYLKSSLGAKEIAALTPTAEMSISEIAGGALNTNVAGMTDAGFDTFLSSIVSGGSAAEGVGAAAGAVGAGEAAGGIFGAVGLGEGAAAVGEGAGIAAGVGEAAAAAEGGGLLDAALTAAAFWIVCTELHKQGKLPLRYYIYGSRKFATYDEQVKKGYYIWAVPAVKHLRQHPQSLYSRFLCEVFNARAEYLAALGGCKSARKSWYGAVVTGSVFGFCWILSRTIARNYNTAANLEKNHAWS